MHKAVVIVFVIAVKLDWTDSSTDPIYTILPYFQHSLSLFFIKKIVSTQNLLNVPYQLHESIFNELIVAPTPKERIETEEKEREWKEN